MAKFATYLLLLLAATSALAQESLVLRAVIGTGSKGDGGQATQALLDGPFGLAEDSAGNVYISEPNAAVIRRVTPDGIIERFAGTGQIADGAQGAAARSTDLVFPTVLAIDRDGGLIFADGAACRIRKVVTSGVIQDLVGTGRCSGSGGGFPGSGGGILDRPPLEIDIGVVGGLLVDGSGRLLFSDETNHVVRRVDEDGIVRTVAGSGGNGYSGDGAAATDALMRSPRGLAYDTAGNLYIADGTDCRVRRVDTEGNISTSVGNGCSASGTLGRLNALVYDADQNALLIAGSGNGRIIRLNFNTRVVDFFAGSGTRGFAETGPATSFPLNSPTGLIRSGARWLVADSAGFRVLSIEGEVVRPFAGYWAQLENYPSASAAPLLRPRGLCTRPDGSLIVIDEGVERSFVYARPDALTLLAGARYPIGYSRGDNGPAADASLNAPLRVACAPDGSVYLTQAGSIRVIDPSGIIRTLLTTVRIDQVTSTVNNPTGVTLDSQGRVLFSETGAHRVIRYDPAARTTTVIAGTGAAGFSGDGETATDALLNSPGDLAFDSHGNLLIADRGNGRVRRVTPAGTIETIAGSSRGLSFNDISGRPATEIGLGEIQGLAVDADDRIYIAESSRLSVVRTDGRIHVLAGVISVNDAGQATYLHGSMNGCDSIAADRDGRVYFSLRYGGPVMAAIPEGLVEEGDPPVISPGGVVTSSAFGALPGASPGSWIEIYGEHLAGESRTWAAQDFEGARAPTMLAGTQVSIGGAAAYLSYVSPHQVNAQVPAGAGNGVVSLTVTTSAGTSEPYSLTISPVQPSLFAPGLFVIAGRQYAGATFADGQTFVLPTGAVSGLVSRPTRAAEAITLYGVGFGPVSPDIPPGQIVQQANTLAAPVRFFVGAQEAAVTYAGLTQGAIGLYQFNIVVPAGLSAGSHPITFHLDGVARSQAVFIPVE